MSRTDAGRGQVQVTVTFLNPVDPRAYPSDLVFDVSLNTHEVNLTGFDPAVSSTLTNEKKEKPASTFRWVPNVEGVHHRRGLLLIPNRGTGGRTLWNSRTRSLTLEIRNLAGVPARTFSWRFR